MTNASLASLRTAFSLFDELPYCDGSLNTFKNEPSFAKLFYRVGGEAAFIDFSDSPTDEALKGLAEACHKTSFDTDALNEAYHNVVEMDTAEFATMLSPNVLGLMNVITTNLLRGRKSPGDIETKLHKLNVYGPGSFVKPHVDTPRGDDMFGTLVLVLPTQHQGGALVFRHSGQEWAVESKNAFSDNESSITYVAFMGDIQHAVLSVVSGYRVTLTYNLHYRKHSAASVPTNVVSLCNHPGLADMRESLSKLLKDSQFLPNGGLIGFGLSHRYLFDTTTKLKQIFNNLKGSDALLRDVCKELKIDVAIKALYHNDEEPDFCLLDRFVSQMHLNADTDEMLVKQLIHQYKAIYCRDLENERTKDAQFEEGEENFTEMVWIKQLDQSNAMKKIHASNCTPGQSAWSYLDDNDSSWSTLYGEICLVARVPPVAERVYLNENKRSRSLAESDAAGTNTFAKKLKLVCPDFELS